MNDPTQFRFKLKPRLAVVLLAGLASMVNLSAHAEHLNAQDCHSYPFVQVSSPTHDQLEHHLALLEAEGYDPNGDQNDYPANMQGAEQKLQHDYARDCLHTSGKRSMQ
jgi:hypothetical protein